MKSDKKIAVVLKEDLYAWQKLNVTAFTVSGIAGTNNSLIGKNYEDASGNTYLPMFKQPVLVFSGNGEQIKKVYERALSKEINFSIFTEELFNTNNDDDNRSAVQSLKQEELRIVGMAMLGKKNTVDKVVKGLSLHK